MNYKITIICIAICLITFCSYIFNNSFRKYVNIYISPYDYHWYKTNVTEELPLPPKTTLNFRSSETNAQYVSRLSLEQIKEFYNKISSQINYDKNVDKIRFHYNNSEIFIEFTKGRIYNFLKIMVVD